MTTWQGNLDTDPYGDRLETRGTVRPLDQVIDLDCAFVVTHSSDCPACASPDSTGLEHEGPVFVSDEAPVSAPEVTTWPDAAGETWQHDVSARERWTLLTGYTGQYGYAGPMMHASEYVGGRLARDILAEPGTYAAVTVTDMTVGELADEWAVARLDEVDEPAALPGDEPVDEREVFPNVRVSTWRAAHDGVPVVQIDTDEDAGRLRINLNDAPVWDGDAETDDAPGAHFPGNVNDMPDPRDDALDRIADFIKHNAWPHGEGGARVVYAGDLAAIIRETGREV